MSSLNSKIASVSDQHEDDCARLRTRYLNEGVELAIEDYFRRGIEKAISGVAIDYLVETYGNDTAAGAAIGCDRSTFNKHKKKRSLTSRQLCSIIQKHSVVRDRIPDQREAAAIGFIEAIHYIQETVLKRAIARRLERYEFEDLLDLLKNEADALPYRTVNRLISTWKDACLLCLMVIPQEEGP